MRDDIERTGGEAMTTRTITLPAEQWSEISEALDCYCDEGCPEGGPGWKSAKLSNACDALAAALAQPEPKGMTDEGILRLAAKELGYEFSSKWFLTGRNCPSLQTSPNELLSFARAVLDRSGLSAKP